MSVPAGFADHAADSKMELIFRDLYITIIIAMDRKAASLSARTSQTVKLKFRNNIIIKIWSYRIVFFNFKGYHSGVGSYGFIHDCIAKAGNQTLVGEVPAFYL